MSHTIDRSDRLVKTCDLSKEEIFKKITEAGLVGMGGATFPTHVKLAVPAGKTAEMLIVNGVECEPFLTADHRLMLEKGAEILVESIFSQKRSARKKPISESKTTSRTRSNV